MGGRLLVFLWMVVTSSIGTRALPSILSIWEGQSDIGLLSLAVSDAEGETWSLVEPQRPHVLARSGPKEGEGWLSRWLSMGGEGMMDVAIDKDRNLTFAHRPSSFPTQLIPRMSFPISGLLVPFKTLLNDSQHHASLSESDGWSGLPREAVAHPEFACFQTPLPRGYEFPPRPWKIALIERGECDFATKVRAAQVVGAAGVVVGDGKLRDDEPDEVGRKRESLITMFSPEDTDSIFIPSVFVSRATFLSLRDLLAHGTRTSGHSGLWVTLGPGADEGATLSSLLSFALLMPTLFLLITIAAHRIRTARQREAERAPPLLVLSLPERIWTPDIVWEKDSDSDADSFHTVLSSPSATGQRPDMAISTTISPSTTIAPPPPIGPSDLPTPPLLESPAQPIASSSKKKKRSKSGISTSGMKYFSKDECAICMDSFHRGEVVRILPCGHVFHKDECDEWLLKWRKLCPTCRADVTSPPGEVATGTTMTPVAAPGEIEAQQRSFRERIVQRLQTRWLDLIPRRAALTGQPVETTPLVRQPSGRRDDDGEV